MRLLYLGKLRFSSAVRLSASSVVQFLPGGTRMSDRLLAQDADREFGHHLRSAFHGFIGNQYKWIACNMMIVNKITMRMEIIFPMKVLRSSKVTTRNAAQMPDEKVVAKKNMLIHSSFVS